MRKLLALVLLLPTLALAASWTLVTSDASLTTGSVTQNLTGTAPSTVADGFDTSGFKWCEVTVCATSGQTITGGGVQAYRYAPHVALWARSSSGDNTLTTGSRCATVPVWQLAPLAGRMDIITNAVTTSGGTTVTVYFQCIPRWASPV